MSATPLRLRSGQALLSHTLSRTVQSARRGLTSVLGMGAGVTRDLFGRWRVIGFVGRRLENPFDGLVEEAGNIKGEREARIILAGFNGVNCLARHMETRRQVRL